MAPDSSLKPCVTALVALLRAANDTLRRHGVGGGRAPVCMRVRAARVFVVCP